MNPMQAQYRSYQQQTQRSPHAAASSSRRGPGPMVTTSHSQTAAQHLALVAQRQQAQMENDNAKRRARKPTDKNLPEGVEDVVIGNGVQQYKDLREVERKLDAVMMRKRLDLGASRPQKLDRTQTLRIWISNTAENQPWQGQNLDENTFDFSTSNEATYRVKIEGRLLEEEESDEVSDSEEEDVKTDGDRNLEKGADEMDHDGTNSSPETLKTEPAKIPSPPARKKLFHFFKSINVELDRNKNLQPEAGSQIEWKKSLVAPNSITLPQAADFDCLEFERKSDENINCTINLHRDETPERYKLSKDLANLLDCEEQTRPGIVLGIWEYIKAMNLQQDEEKRIILCDERLRALFKADSIFFPQIPDLIMGHISSLPPVKLPYTIRVDPEYHASPVPTIYDIRVATDDPLRAKMQAITQDASFPATLRQISTLDEQLAGIIQAVNHSKSKHAFFTSMSKDPATFLRRWNSSQKRDLEMILGEGTRGGGEDGSGEEFRRGGRHGVWGSNHVRESVGLMVSKR